MKEHEYYVGKRNLIEVTKQLIISVIDEKRAVSIEVVQLLIMSVIDKIEHYPYFSFLEIFCSEQKLSLTVEVLFKLFMNKTCLSFTIYRPKVVIT